jgi:hypothetical protein
MGTAIGKAGLVALPRAGLAAAVRAGASEPLSRPYPFGDEGLAALLAAPPPAGTLSLPTGGLKKLESLDLGFTQVTGAGCAALRSPRAALDRGALPALERICLDGIPASAAAKEAVSEALERSRAAALTAATSLTASFAAAQAGMPSWLLEISGR